MSTSNQDLSGDVTKNVNYWILFIKRDLEGTLKPSTPEIVNYSTDGANYGALKLSEFAATGTTFPLPETWAENGYPHSWPVPLPDPRPQLTVGDIPPEDRRFIRFFYEVKELIPKETADYEKRQTRALEGIETILDERL